MTDDNQEPVPPDDHVSDSPVDDGLDGGTPSPSPHHPPADHTQRIVVAMWECPTGGASVFWDGRPTDLLAELRS